MCRLFRLWLNMIDSCNDSVNIDRPWLAHLLTFLTKFDPDMIICRLCRVKSWNQHSLAPVSTLVTFVVPDLILCDFVDCLERNDEIDTHWLLCRFWWLLSYLIWSCATLSTVIAPLPLICRLCRLRLTLILLYVDSIDRDRRRLADVSICRLFLKMICSCVDFFGCEWKWSTHAATLSTLIDPDWLICRLCWLNLHLLSSFVDSVERSHQIDTHWLLWWLLWYLIWSCANFSAVSNEIMKPTLIGSCVVSGDFYCTWFNLVRLCLLWSTLIGSCVDFIDCDQPRWAHLPNMLTLIEHNCLVVCMCWRCATLIGFYVDYFKLNLTWSACVSDLSTVIDSDWRICRICWLRLNTIVSFLTVLTLRDLNWLICRLCWIKFNLINLCVEFGDSDRPQLAHVSNLLTVINSDWRICRICWLWLNTFVSFFDCVDVARP